MISVRAANKPEARHDTFPERPPAIWAEHITPALDEEIGVLPSPQGFTAMLEAYQPTGGAAHGDEIARLLKERHRGDFVSFARLIVSSKVVGFEWRNSFWIPMFQFQLGDLSINSAPQQVLAELAMEYDGWTSAAWLVRPNAWLNRCRPIELLDSNLEAVLKVAREEHYISVSAQ